MWSVKLTGPDVVCAHAGEAAAVMTHHAKIDAPIGFSILTILPSRFVLCGRSAPNLLERTPIMCHSALSPMSYCFGPYEAKQPDHTGKALKSAPGGGSGEARELQGCREQTVGDVDFGRAPSDRKTAVPTESPTVEGD